MSKKSLRSFNIKKVPFVPALDLLEKETNKLSIEEAAALALALFRSLGGKFNNKKSAWELNAMTQALSQRM